MTAEEYPLFLSTPLTVDINGTRQHHGDVAVPE